MTAFDDYNSAARLRETISRIVQQEIARQFPKARYAQVVSISTANSTIMAKYPGEETPFLVRCHWYLPVEAGQVVLVDGPVGDKKLVSALGPVQFVSGNGPGPNPTVVAPVGEQASIGLGKGAVGYDSTGVGADDIFINVADGVRVAVDRDEVLISPDMKIRVRGHSEQFAPTLVLEGSIHEVSTRAAALFNEFLVGQDAIGDGTRNFFVFDNTAGAHRLRLDPEGHWRIYKDNAVGSGASWDKAHLALVDESGDHVANLALVDGEGGGVQLLWSSANGSVLSVVNANNDGYAAVWGGAYTNQSTRDSKTDIRTLESDGDVIDRLRPVVFKWKNHSQNRDRLGLIAEEVDDVLPEIVDYVDDKPIGLQYDGVIPLLLAEVQQLRRRLANVEARLASKEV